MPTQIAGEMATATHERRAVVIDAAEQCNRDDDEWTYRAVPSKRPGLYVLGVTDSEGEFLGYI